MLNNFCVLPGPRMDLQLCDFLYVRHSLGSAERLRKEGLSAEIYKVSNTRRPSIIIIKQP